MSAELAKARCRWCVGCVEELGTASWLGICEDCLWCTHAEQEWQRGFTPPKQWVVSALSVYLRRWLN